MKLAQPTGIRRTGLRLMDCDHREMEDHFLAICNTLAAGGDHERLARMLKQLERFTQLHFAMEEGMMGAVRFPAGKQHRLHHQQLAQQIHTLAEDFLTRKDDLRDSMAQILAQHTGHIEEEDLGFGTWLNQTLPD